MMFFLNVVFWHPSTGILTTSIFHVTSECFMSYLKTKELRIKTFGRVFGLSQKKHRLT